LGLLRRDRSGGSRRAVRASGRTRLGGTGPAGDAGGAAAAGAARELLAWVRSRSPSLLGATRLVRREPR